MFGRCCREENMPLTSVHSCFLVPGLGSFWWPCHSLPTSRLESRRFWLCWGCVSHPQAPPSCVPPRGPRRAPEGLSCLSLSLRSSFLPGQVSSSWEFDQCSSLRGFAWRKVRSLASPPFHCSCCCSVAKSCPTLCDTMDGSTPGLSVHHPLLKLAQTRVHWVSDAIQPSPSLSSPSPPTFNLSQHRGLFQWVSCSHQGAKGLELPLQHQSFQWIFRVDFP